MQQTKRDSTPMMRAVSFRLMGDTCQTHKQTTNSNRKSNS